MAVRPPILAKIGRKKADKYFLTIFRFFRGSLDIQLIFVVVNLVSKKSLCRIFSVFCIIFFSNWPGNLGETWQQYSNRICNRRMWYLFKIVDGKHDDEVPVVQGQVGAGNLSAGYLNILLLHPGPVPPEQEAMRTDQSKGRNVTWVYGLQNRC